MPPPAVTIDDAILLAPNYIAQVSYGVAAPPTLSLLTQMNLWIDGMFSKATGIFPPANDTIRSPGQRVVTDWLGTHKMAVSDIEGPGVGAAGVVGTSAVINAVERALVAVKFGVINSNPGVTVGTQTAVIALFNTVWS